MIIVMPDNWASNHLEEDLNDGWKIISSDVVHF